MEQQTEPTVALSLTVKDTAIALRFYAEALGAVERFRLPAPDGGVAHAEFSVGNTRIYISDEAEEWHAFAMPEGGTASCLFSIVTANCDEAYNRAIRAGAESLRTPENMFWGTRSAIIKDPFGYRWAFNQLIEKLSPEEVAKRAQALYTTTA